MANLSPMPGGGQAGFATVDEVRAAALARLAPEVADYLEGGAGDELTIARNRAAFDRWALHPRVMSGSPAPSLATSFMGIELGLPILTAPFGGDVMFHPDGHKEVAIANRKAGSLSIVPEGGSWSLEEVQAAAPGSPKLGQLHPLGSDATFGALVRRFEAAGYQGLCITCDCPTVGWRERNRRNRFEPPDEVYRGNYPAGADDDPFDELFADFSRHAVATWSWDRLGRLLAGSSLPWMAKGILTADDAVAAVDAGASAVLVSNHGGRQLDGVAASLEVLPEIADAVGDRADIALDSGVRRGTDIVKALALGADVVVLGRLAVYGLVAGGAAGVGNVLDLLADELANVLTLLGRGGVADLDRAAIRRAEG